MARRVVAALAALVVANAAVPDLPADARESTAELILVGKITSATAEDVSRREGHVDSVSIGQFAVSKVEKGEAPDTQTVYWWAPKARPDGWTGHQGQRPAPPAKKSIKIFTDGHGELLVPNGWEFAEEEEEAVVEEAAAAEPEAVEEPEAAAEPAAAAEEVAEAEPAEAGEVVERKEHPVRAFFRQLRKVLGGPMAFFKKLFAKKK
jgi:hypothetical protein